MIVTSWYQEDVAEGLVATWASGGIKPKTANQANAALQPTKLANRRGVMFSVGTTQNMQWATDSDAPNLHRWWIGIARCNTSLITGGNTVIVANVNGASGGATNCQPAMYFLANTKLSSIISDSTASRFVSVDCSSDVETWNVLVGHRRNGIHHAWVNGVAGTSVPHHSWSPNNSGGTLSFFGNWFSNSKSDMAIDCWITGQSELSDDQVDKLVAWGMWRCGRAADLSGTNPYKTALPVTVDDPYRYYEWDSAAWDAWVASITTRYDHRGEAAPAITGYSTVLFDDFINHSVVLDLAGEESNIWFAPTWLNVVNVMASAQLPSATPTSYVHDAVNHTMSLRLLYSAGWKSGAFMSVTKQGAQGRTWKGATIFEIKAKFRKNGVDGGFVAPGLFPAFWSYGIVHQMWRTRNRIETDFLEYDHNGDFINTTQHVHSGHLLFSDPGVSTTNPSQGIADFYVRTATDPDISGTIDAYDGNYHIWYMQIEDDYTYVVLDGEEMTRVATSQELSAEKYIMCNLAYSTPSHGSAALTTDTYDMCIDYIRVRQKEVDLAVVPAEFTARATLSGTAMDGEALSVTPNTTGQLTYRWYRDGVPLVGQILSAYTLTADDIGHKVRCHVQNFSYNTRPYSWTAESATVVAIPVGVPDVVDGTGQVGTYLWAEGTAPRQWYRDGVAIAGEVDESYLIVEADNGTDITTINSSLSPSNAIACTWARCTFDGSFQLDMDAQNTRYWFAGVEYNEADFEALTWVPDTMNGVLINRLFTTGALPYPGFDSSDGFVAMGLEATTDNGTETAVFDFSNNTSAEWASVMLRWQSAKTSRLNVNDGGVSQVSINGPGMTSGVQYHYGAKFRANDFWLIEASSTIMVEDVGGTMPTLTQMRTGAIQNGVNVAAGAIHRVAVTSGNVPLMEVQHAMLKTSLTIAYDAEVLSADGLDALDIFGDGFDAIVNANQDGKIYLYRQQSRGKFTRTAIRSTVYSPGTAKVEGVVFIDSRGDGDYQVVVCDQNLNLIRLYEPTVPGDYTQANWTETTIRSNTVPVAANVDSLQDVKAITTTGDDRQSLFYTFEGGSGGTGGISKLRWDGASPASFVNTVIAQQSGAWGIGVDLFANGDILFGSTSAAIGRNPGGVPGLWRVTQAGVKTTIHSGDSTRSWGRCCVGDFFGNGNEDVAATHADGTTEAFALFNSASAWAKTTINHTAETAPNVVGFARNHNCQNLGYKANGRDALFICGEGHASVWEWSGSAWAPVQTWTGIPSNFKGDDVIARMNITRRPKPDIVISDSQGNELIVLAIEV